MAVLEGIQGVVLNLVLGGLVRLADGSSVTRQLERNGVVSSQRVQEAALCQILTYSSRLGLCGCGWL